MDVPEIRFESIAELTAFVTPENCERLAVDFAQFLHIVAHTKATMPELRCLAFIWKDDGIEGLSEIRLKVKS